MHHSYIFNKREMDHIIILIDNNLKDVSVLAYCFVYAFLSGNPCVENVALRRFEGLSSSVRIKVFRGINARVPFFKNNGILASSRMPLEEVLKLVVYSCVGDGCLPEWLIAKLEERSQRIGSIMSRFVRSPDPACRRRAIRLLDRTRARGKIVMRLLARSLHDPDDTVCSYAMTALARRGQEGLPFLESWDGRARCGLLGRIHKEVLARHPDTGG